VAFRVTDADVARACTIGNRAIASRGSSRLSPRRKSKEPLSRRVKQTRREKPIQQKQKAGIVTSLNDVAKVKPEREDVSKHAKDLL